MLTSVICAIIKDETEYLEEWIRYHLDIGFTHIVLYQDRGSDSHKDIVEKFGDFVTLISLEEEKYNFLFTIGFLKQMTLYHLFMVDYYQKFNWVTFIDIDEYITFGHDYSLQQLLLDNQFSSSFTIQWKVIGADGHIEKCKNITDSYFNDVSVDYEFGYIPTKVFVNLYDITPLDFCHFPAIPERRRYYYSDGKVWINHYYTKSWDDWCERFIKKGDLCPGNRDIVDFFRVNKNMLPLKKELFERFYNKNHIKRQTCDFVHVFTPEINDCFTQVDGNKELSLVYDILSYTLSFIYLKKMDRKIKLYCSDWGKKCLSHLEYDEIIIIPEEYENKNNLTNIGLLYALEKEPLTSCFIHGDCFLRDDVILGVIETSVEDLITLTSKTVDKNNSWDFTFDKKECSASFLTPHLSTNIGAYDTSILKFNNALLKEEFITKYKENVKNYQNSLYCKFCMLSTKVTPDRYLFNNLLWDIVNNTFSCKEIIGVGTWPQLKDERIKEKIDFFKILHLTDSSKFYDKEKCVKNMTLTLKKHSPILFEILNNEYKLIKP